MSLQKCALKVDKESKELRVHGTIGFPCTGYNSVYEKDKNEIIPWHWHDEFEIIYIEEGTLEVKTPGFADILRTGDCLILNSNILHYARTAQKCGLHSIVFHKSLITGNDESVFARKYIDPLMSCASFGAYLVKKEELPIVKRAFEGAFEALENEVFSYEFIVRESLCEIFLLLYKIYEPEIGAGIKERGRDNLRIRRMLEFIHSNFSENITLAQIAQAANISERECLRCFKKTIKSSPVQYLMRYRIMRGADILVSESQKNVSEIALFCGFDSPANFSRIFKRFYGRTPKDFREWANRTAENFL